MNMISILVIDNTKYYPTFDCSYKEGFLFISKYHHRINYWKPKELSTFTGSEREKQVIRIFSVRNQYITENKQIKT